ncbi:ras-related protein Rab-23 isoform X2 [Oryx dammah]|uniref:ras-related protein Rab-23 isoform X2 n=1 Tax=Oryx dammah TaxID=59534 RepID=UPI001A9BB987|nr:ras-related protein Rab-23 isoform X2 [Oryx dammah]
MLEEDMEVAIKTVVVGNGAVGKSSMIQRYCKGVFTKDYKKTIGVDFLERQIQVNDEDVRLMLWDTAGQEEFDAITKAYYRGAQACVLVFSTTDRESFEAISSWREKVVAEVGDIPTALVQNKIDLLDDSCIKNEEAEALAKKLKLRFYRTSVKEDLNVSEVLLAPAFVAVQALSLAVRSRLPSGRVARAIVEASLVVEHSWAPAQQL